MIAVRDGIHRKHAFAAKGRTQQHVLFNGDCSMIVTVFRSRLLPGVKDDYVSLANRMNELAQTMPGYISHKGFFADDGERVTVVEFASEEGMRAWRMNPEHRAAQKKAREVYYSEYNIQVCNVVREAKFKREDT